LGAIRECAMGLGVALVSCGVALPAAAPRADAQAVVAIYPPWWDRTRTLEAAAAAGAVLPGPVSFAVLMYAPDAQAAARLRRAGALVVLDGEAPWCSARRLS